MDYLALFRQLISALENAKTVLLTVHVSPDGDALGTMLACRHVLEEKYSHLTRIDGVMVGQVADNLTFLPGSEDVKDIETDTDILAQYDLAICVDCGASDRLGAVETLFHGATLSVNLDHHISNERFANLNIVMPEAAASGEVVADLMDMLNVQPTKDIAVCLYTALITDTGGFKFSNTSSKTHRLAARCMEAGCDHEWVYKQIYENRPWSQVKLMTEALSTAQFNKTKTLCWTVVSKTMREETGAEEQHVDGLVDSLRQIDSVLLAAVFKELDDGQVKVSLRSDDHGIDVAVIAAQFGGGGHKMAAGCSFNQQDDLAVAQEKLLPLLEAALSNKTAVKQS